MDAAKRILEEGYGHFEKNNFKDALRCFSNFVALYPNDYSEAHHNRAVCFRMLKRIEEMAEVYEHMIERDLGDFSKTQKMMQNQIGSYFVEHGYESRLHAVAMKLHLSNRKLLIGVLGNKGRYGEVGAFLRDMYSKGNGHCVESMPAHIRYVIEAMCADKDPTIFVFEKLFEDHKFYFMLGLCYYFRGQYELAKAPLKHKFVAGGIKWDDVRFTFYASSMLRSIVVLDKQHLEIEKMVRDRNAGTWFDEYFLFSVYNCCYDDKDRDPKNGVAFIMDLNDRQAKSMGLRIARQWKPLRVLDQNTQVLKIKDAILRTTKIKQIVSSGDALVAGRMNYFTSDLTQYVKPYKNEKDRHGDEQIQDGKNKNKSLRRLKGRALGFNICNQGNYYHILCEMMVRLCVLEECGLLEDCLIVLVPEFPGWARKMLGAARFKMRGVYYHKKNEDVQFDELYMVDMKVNDEIDYLSSWSCYCPSPYGLNCLRRKFVGAEEEEGEEEEANTKTQPPRVVVYISRNGNIRNVENEGKLIESVLKPLFGDSLVLFDNEFLSKHADDPLNAQISLFKSADVVVGAHGAGLSNLVWCRRGTPIVEFVMKPFCNQCFRYMAEVLGMKYFGCEIMTSLYHGRYTFEKEKHAGPLKEYISKATGCASLCTARRELGEVTSTGDDCGE